MQRHYPVIEAGELLWKALRNRALGGYKSRRQHPIGPYVVDFACLGVKVAVEVDVSHLVPRRSDIQRTAYLENNGWLVLRYWNNEIYDDLDPVKEAIYRECVKRSVAESPPSPQP